MEKSEGVARITIDKPPLNVLDIKSLAEINSALEDIKADPGIKVVVFAAAGRAFSAGVDVKDHLGDKVVEMITTFNRMFRLMASLEQPTLAVVGGAALGGGCEIAMFCDMVIASEKASFGQPEIRVGVYPPLACVSLPRVIGRKKALELILTGDTIDAQEALRLGLVNHVVPTDSLEEEANKLVQKLATLSGPVLKLTKRACFQGLDGDFEEVLSKVEDIYFNELMKTEDANEGLQAFVEKRPPVWREK